MTETPKIPPGVVGILTNDAGQVIVTQTDFETAGYSGFDLYDAQKIRVRRRITCEFFRDFCHPILNKVIADHTADEAIRKMCRDHGYRLTYIPIGHDDEAGETE